MLTIESLTVEVKLYTVEIKLIMVESLMAGVDSRTVEIESLTVELRTGSNHLQLRSNRLRLNRLRVRIVYSDTVVDIWSVSLLATVDFIFMQKSISGSKTMSGHCGSLPFRRAGHKTSQNYPKGRKKRTRTSIKNKLKDEVGMECQKVHKTRFIGIIDHIHYTFLCFLFNSLYGFKVQCET